jgi:hypothetical protein
LLFIHWRRLSTSDITKATGASQEYRQASRQTTSHGVKFSGHLFYHHLHGGEHCTLDHGSSWSMAAWWVDQKSGEWAVCGR